MRAGAVFSSCVGVWLVVAGLFPDVGYELLARSFFVDPARAGPATPFALGATVVSGALTLFIGVIAWTLQPALLVPAARPIVGRALAISLLVWFVVDSTASIVVGAPMNAVWNVSELVALLPPSVHAWRAV